MDDTERAACQSLLVEVTKDIREFQEELRGIDRRASQEATDRHRVLTEQIVSMLASRVQLQTLLDE